MRAVVWKMDDAVGTVGLAAAQLQQAPRRAEIATGFPKRFRVLTTQKRVGTRRGWQVPQEDTSSQRCPSFVYSGSSAAALLIRVSTD